MNIKSALDTATEASRLFDNVSLKQLSEAEKTGQRRRDIGFVFQSVALLYLS
jgi:ABC-type lipoprotein export system ATPase subunit